MFWLLDVRLSSCFFWSNFCMSVLISVALFSLEVPQHEKAGCKIQPLVR